MTRIKRTCGVLRSLLVGLTVSSLSAQAAVELLYATGFEHTEGFDAAYELPQQNGWVGYPYFTNEGAINASGIISNTTSPPSQEAYVGFFAPSPPRSFVSVWKPVNHIPAERPVVRFEVLMTITPSSANRPNLDIFRWSVYNMEGNRLFSIDFDNFFLDVSYELDGAPTNVVTSQRFTNDVPFRFSLTMDFLSNRWSAAMDEAPFLTGLPITTTNAPLNLGDVDAVWAIINSNAPGDNFMVFDDYRVTAEPAGTDTAWLRPLGLVAGGFLLQLYGPESCRYAVDVSTNLATWTPLKTNVVTGGYFDYLDTPVRGSALRAYRARLVP
jgi:hypothetical protein